ncbi:uncharacterized protein LOC110415810 [Herrania umbratica]|uniref:Uncharacterized protein LOC110415810 n=1 Tax=Herrania umbratica TaxID=108875 RepID=A0A6J1A8X3_9ROSI|nr:uncharacterized protein LOC110415810 [Herrania umbratica]
MQSRQKTDGMRKLSLLLMSKRCTLSQRNHLRRRARENLGRRMKMLKAEMRKISKEQESIRREQREVKEKFDMVEFECEQLRRQTEFITQQSLNTQRRLCLMFQILKARETNDFTKAAGLTQILRELIAKRSKEK